MTLTISVLLRGAMGQQHIQEHIQEGTLGMRKGRAVRNLVLSTTVQRVIAVLYSTGMTSGNSL